jgi:hypothetical protein
MRGLSAPGADYRVSMTYPLNDPFRKSVAWLGWKSMVLVVVVAAAGVAVVVINGGGGGRRGKWRRVRGGGRHNRWHNRRTADVATGVAGFMGPSLTPIPVSACSRRIPLVRARMPRALCVRVRVWLQAPTARTDAPAPRIPRYG